MQIDPFQTKFSPEVADRFYATLQSDGLCCVENAISPETLTAYREEVARLLKLNGRRFLFLQNPYKDAASAFRGLGTSNNFKKFLVYLSNRQAQEDTSDFELLNYLRVVPGDKAKGQALNFHFDAEVITALVPIDIPDGAPDKAGHLVALPNFRKLRHSVVINVLEKALIQNKLTRWLISRMVLRNGSQKYIYKLVPGNIYFFWGYRTLHANLPLDPAAVRSTMLFHFGNPHQSSSIVKFIKSRHRQVDLQSDA